MKNGNNGRSFLLVLTNIQKQVFICSHSDLEVGNDSFSGANQKTRPLDTKIYVNSNTETATSRLV